MQLDQDFGQLIGWLNEKSQQAIFWFQRHKFSHDVNQLTEVLGNGIHEASSWLHVLAACFAFVSDILKPLAPRFTKWLAIGGFTLWVPPFVGINLHIVPEEPGSIFIVSCLLVAVLSSVMLFLQRGHEHGALAELVPVVERLIGIVKTKIDEVKKDTGALREAQEKEKARSEERHKEAIEGQKRLERLVIDAAGGSASAAQAVAEMKRILEDLQKPARPEDFSGTVKRVLDGYSKALTLDYFITLARLSATAALMHAAQKSEAQIDQGMVSICGLSKLSENEIDYVWTLLEIPIVLRSVGPKWPLKTRARVNEHFQLLDRVVSARSNEMEAVWKVTSALGYLLWVEAPKQQAEQLLEVLRQIDVVPANKNEIISGLTSSINDERIRAMEMIRVLLLDKIIM